MSDLKSSYQVAVVGGGPVGLFLGISLISKGIDCIVLERRAERITHSRSLGIHPVSLELMSEFGLAQTFADAGLKIRRGVAFSDNRKLGTLSFDHCPGPFPYVLALPQYRTEQLLEEKLLEMAPDRLIRGAEVVDIEEMASGVTLTLTHVNNRERITCRMLAGCDGKKSKVRKAAGITFSGKRYSDTYLMGDFSDNTDLGSTAAIYLHSRGLVESFPLDLESRRWVAKTDSFISDPDREILQKIVNTRTGYDLSTTANAMLSSFGVQRYMAKPMAKGRTFLAGDAAHIVSPIGGQGMNLGWLDARDLANLLHQMLAKNRDLSAVVTHYHRKRSRAARKAIRRAELNMALGRKNASPYARNSLIWMMLNTPLERLMARVFTMRGLDNWPI
ncbi:MAG: NAD(P)/FAD-dependent oxidoreductase [Balneolaceae bacterium]|nr:NAD(P)/FAD-dependent oxidoreductase [Balneolaceae bacterium]